MSHREYIPEGQTGTGKFNVSALEWLQACVYRVRPELVEKLLNPTPRQHAGSFLIDCVIVSKEGILTIPYLSCSVEIALRFFLLLKMKSHLKELIIVVQNAVTSDDYQAWFESWEQRCRVIGRVKVSNKILVETWFVFFFIGKFKELHCDTSYLLILWFYAQSLPLQKTSRISYITFSLISKT